MCKLKKILLGTLLGTLALSSTMVIAHANTAEEEKYNNLPSFYNTSDYFRSNKFTNYYEDSGVAPAPINSLEASDKLFKETSTGKFYLNKSDLSFKYESKSNNYIHSSTVNEVNERGIYRNFVDETKYQNARFPINIKYFDAENAKEANMGFYITDKYDNPTKNADFTLTENENGYSADITFPSIGIEIKLNIEFKDNQVIATIPYESIKETNPKYVLGSIRLFSHFGAVEKDNPEWYADETDYIENAMYDEVDGYTFVPDGTGALIRFNDYSETILEYGARVYGDDNSLPKVKLSEPMSTISMPVFGYVHGENFNGCLGIVENGKEYCKINANHASTANSFFTVYPEFIYRSDYSQPTNNTGGQITLVQSESNNFDAKVIYTFLEGEDASYIGMAKKYRDYLLSNSMLNESNKEYDTIPLRVDTIGNEVTNGVMFKKRINMTTFEDYRNILNALNEKDINNVVSVFKGYTKDGLTWTSPDYDNISNSLGSLDDLESLDNVYFHTDHVFASANQNGYNQRKDLTNRINTQIISVGEGDGVKYHLSSDFTNEKMLKDTKKLNKLGINNFALDSIGNTLYSDYGDKDKQREEVKNAYESTLSNVEGNIALYQPNDYLLKYTDRNFDYSMYNNQYMIFDDSVPFTSIVQSGNIELYSTYINFFGNVRDDLLRMVDYNVYPSFLLTYESSSLLEETALQYIYCSQFSNLEDAVYVYYDFVNKALKDVVGATIENREVLQEGVVQVTYSNGKKIIVNYQNHDVIINNEVVEKKGYKVI